MNVVINHVFGVLTSYREEEIGIHDLVHAVEVLRDYTEVAPSRVDKIYMHLVNINSICLDQKRPLTFEESQEVADLVEQLFALLSGKNIFKTLDVEHVKIFSHDWWKDVIVLDKIRLSQNISLSDKVMALICDAADELNNITDTHKGIEYIDFSFEAKEEVLDIYNYFIEKLNSLA